MRTIRCAPLLLAGVLLRGAPAPLPLAHPGTAPILVTPGASPVERFAAAELARYLGQISGESFSIAASSAVPAGPVLLVGPAWLRGTREAASVAALGEDGFILRRDHGRVYLAGGGDRGTLYAVYDFLERLGCRWFAPNFAFYGPAGGERVPHLADPAIGALEVSERPSFPERELYIEEGETDTPAALLALVEWMGKARMNVLGCPINYQAEGRTKWDNWRALLIPELAKRGILPEIGGHGYQVFLPAERYFARHPEWFGMEHGRRTEDPHVVFATSNPQAMATYIANVRSYLRAHPEIAIFDCRPPDGARWSRAPADVALGSPSDRQLLLIDQLAAALKDEFPRIKIRFEAYSAMLAPATRVKPAGGTDMEFCPIARSFDFPLFDPSCPENAAYQKDLDGWVGSVVPAAKVTICTYITKYQWRTLPILLPHLIATEARYYARMGLEGEGSYCEPGGWATYELDHYCFARLLWQADIEPDALLRDYAAKRFGPAAESVLAYLKLAEAVVPRAVAIPGTHLTLPAQRRYVARFSRAAALLAEAKRDAAGDPRVLDLVDKLDRARRYGANEMALRLEFLQGAEGWRRDQLARIQALLNERSQLIEEDRTLGLMVVDARTP